MIRWKFHDLFEEVFEATHKRTQRELAEELGLHRATVQELRSGELARVNARVVDIILTWASTQLRRKITANDVIEFSTDLKKWEPLESWKDWDHGLQRRSKKG